MSRTGGRIARTLRRETTRVVGVVLAIAFVLGIVRGGSRYLYCPFMDAVVTEHCCSDATSGQSAIEATDCCQPRTIGTLPIAGATAQPPELSTSSLLAVLPAAHEMSTGVSFTPPSRFGPERTGPPPRPRSERTARLMVFLI